MNYSSTFRKYFTRYLSLGVLGAFPVLAIALGRGIGPALSKIAEKHPDTVSLKFVK